MATYTTVSNMLAVVAAIGSNSNLTSAALHGAIVNAEALVNGRIARQYSLPIASTPVPLLTAIATDLSLYRVLAMSVFTQEQLKDSQWPRVFKEAMATLDQIAAGGLSLVDSAGAIVSPRGDLAPALSSTSDYLPTFTELEPVDWVQDSEKLDALRDERLL